MIKGSLGASVLIFFISLFLISFVSGLPLIQLESESYQPHETLIGSIEGASPGLSKENIKLFQERRELTVNKDIHEFAGKYYFYLALPDEGDYKLEIKGIVYDLEGTVGYTDFVKELSVKDVYSTNNKTQIITILPGVIDSLSEKVSVYVTNSGTKNVSLGYLNETVSLDQGELKRINLLLNTSFTILKIKSYREFGVPLIYRGIIPESNVSNQTQNISNQTLTSLTSTNITSTIDVLKIVATIDQIQEQNITLINLGNSLENIVIKEDESFLNLSSTEIPYFENKSIMSINFSVLFNEEGFYEDNLRFFINETEIFRIPVEINVFANQNLSKQYEMNNSIQQKSCESIGGKICLTNENCEGDYTYAGGLCCLGSCEKISGDETNPANLVVGIIILLIFIAGTYYFYKKIKNVKKQTPEEKIKQIEEKKD